MRERERKSGGRLTREFSTKSAGAVEDTNCISAEMIKPTPNECPKYDTKPSGVEAPVLALWGMLSTPSLPLLLVSL